MKTVKVTLIVIATLVGVCIAIFFITALIGGASQAISNRNEYYNNTTLESKIDSFITANKGKMVVLDTAGAFSLSGRIPLYNGISIYGKTKRRIKPGDSVMITGDLFIEHRIPIKYRGVDLYTNYEYIPELKKLMKIDPAFKYDK